MLISLLITIFSGLIGRSWAMLFASAGYKVHMYDVSHTQVATALKNILVQLKDLQEAGLLRGKLSVEQQHELISGTNTLQTCVEGAKYVQVISTSYTTNAGQNS